MKQQLASAVNYTGVAALFVLACILSGKTGFMPYYSQALPLWWHEVGLPTQVLLML